MQDEISVFKEKREQQMREIELLKSEIEQIKEKSNKRIESFRQETLNTEGDQRTLESKRSFSSYNSKKPP